ncbi:hypothetical protein [Dactylosporangium sp. NPDC005555]|uniref:hypothetical protein n=1 Tax=Dactylosporangium sp. NPDC005555 TaxID=3154889 RepID=UPI0033A612A5
MARANLRRAVDPADDDVGGEDGEADAVGLVDLDRAVRPVEDDGTEAADGPELGAGRLHVQLGAGGQLHGHVDGARAAEQLVPHPGADRDPQDAVAVFDRGLLRHLDVAALRGVGGPDLNGRVGPVTGDELDAARGDVEDRGDRGGGVEGLHRALLCPFDW